MLLEIGTLEMTTQLKVATIISLLFKPRPHCPGVRPGGSWQFVAGGPGRTGTNLKGIRVRSYIPDRATDQTRFGANIDRVCYGLRRRIPGVAPEALRCVPVRPNTPRLCPRHQKQCPGVTTGSHGSRTAKLKCYTVTYKYQ